MVSTLESRKLVRPAWSEQMAVKVVNVVAINKGELSRRSVPVLLSFLNSSPQ